MLPVRGAVIGSCIASSRRRAARTRFLLIETNSLSAVLVAAALAVATGACCPDPIGADSGASASSSEAGGSLAFEPKLSAIQTGLFDKRCVTDCHEATSPASGLSLAPGRSYKELLNQASQQLGTAVRVVSGDPDRSYLVKKLEGSKGIVGEVMPRLAPERPQAEIDAVRSWIKRGARND
jgi:hypothetical protein